MRLDENVVGADRDSHRAESPTSPPESPRPVITDPQVALDRLMAGNQRFVDAQMQHPDQGLGDLLVARVVGNIVGPALLGSVEYAVGHLKTPLIVVIGHEKCGAVEATLESIQHHQRPHGDIAALVTAITPAVAVAQQRPGDLLDNTIRANAEQSLDAIKKSSELTGPLASGQLKAIAAYYSIDDGRISLI